MDFPDRLEISLRYWILSVMSLFGLFENVNFFKQIKRISDIKNNNDYDNKIIRSDESETCAMAEGSDDIDECDKTFESIGTGESFEESESGEIIEGEPYGIQYHEGRFNTIPDDSLWSSDVIH